MPWRETPEELARARAELPLVVPAPQGRVFGILTPAAPESRDVGLCVVFLTRPRSHRNRMWVEGARFLAARGFTCFRYDFHGTGDSESDSAPLDPDRPYREELVAILRHLRQAHGQARFVLCGSCFDARTALSAFADEGGCVEGLVYMVGPATVLLDWDRANADYKGWSHLARALGKRENWRALVSARRWRYMGAVIARVLRRSVGRATPGEDLEVSENFRRDFRALARSRARVLFLFGAEDSVYRAFRPAERTLLAALDAATRARITHEVWPGNVHGFVEMNRQREVFERVMRWIEDLAPRPGTSRETPRGA
jgi:pimeloyl-ACP methyl ester carboxylesterase